MNQSKRLATSVSPKSSSSSACFEGLALLVGAPPARGAAKPDLKLLCQGLISDLTLQLELGPHL